MKLKVPKGWRLLKIGDEILDGDKFWLSGTKWANSALPKNQKVIQRGLRYIRKEE